MDDLIAGTERGVLVTRFWYIRAARSADAAVHRADARRPVPDREGQGHAAGEEHALEREPDRRAEQHRRDDAAGADVSAARGSAGPTGSRSAGVSRGADPRVHVFERVGRSLTFAAPIGRGGCVMIARMRPAVLATTLLLLGTAASAETHKFKPTAGVPDLRGAAAGPDDQARRHGRDRDVLAARRLLRSARRRPWPGEVGPFHIEGAAPGDTLVVRILKLTPNRDIAISNVTPNGISGVAGDSRTRMLNDPLPPRRFVWQLDRARMVGILDLPNSASKRIELPLRPMLGRVAVAPAGEEAWGGLWPGDFGGNLDASDVGAGRDRLPAGLPSRARSSTSATSTRCRATARSPARASSRRRT